MQLLLISPSFLAEHAYTWSKGITQDVLQEKEDETKKSEKMSLQKILFIALLQKKIFQRIKQNPNFIKQNLRYYFQIQHEK